MKKASKFISIVCVLAMFVSIFSIVSQAENTKEINYTIVNPYAGVNWDTYSQYKADFHSHTNASDGTASLKEMTESHYSYNFDIVAVTDHGVVDYGWTSQHTIPAMKVIIKTFKDRGGVMESLNANGGTAANGNTYSLVTKDGGDYYYQTDSEGNKSHEMLRVPFGIENNPSSINNAHVNSWFVDYGDGKLGGTSDYVTPISNVDALGGLCVINHPGEYTSARDELYTADAYNYNNLKYRYQIDKFAGLLTKYKACIGIDVNSKSDSRTRFDRKLWDILLEKVVPTGRNVLALATSDAHGTSVTYSGYTMMCMEKNTVANLKESLQNGAFFAASKYIGNYDEITEIAKFLNEKTDAESLKLGSQLSQISKSIEVELANGGQDSKYNAPFDVEAPQVNKIAVDDDNDSITLSTTSDALLVRWIANGKTIATGNTIDLDDYSDEIGSYVRAEIFGEGGIVYTQAFMLKYDNAPQAKENKYIDLWWFASFIPDNIVRFLAAIPIFKLIWNLMEH